MKKGFWMQALAAGLIAGLSSLAAAQSAPAGDANQTKNVARPATGEDVSTREESSVTEHSVHIGNQLIPYKATALTIAIKNQAGETTGLMYAVAYTRSDVKDLTTRPISFFYNGGPGSATMWLHMGAFGPRRVSTPDGVFTAPAPYKLVDNGESLLDKTDMVFIDAMGTGYSRIVGKGKPSDFNGVDEDMDSFAQFINSYINHNDRWNSPKFLMGESYGTFRSAVVGNYLQNRYSMHLNGIVLISSVLDLSSITFGQGDDRPYEYYLPSYAAVAWYHKALKNRPANLDAFIEEARQYAKTDYAVALFKGDKITPTEAAVVAKRLSYFTGLSEEYLLKAHLRVALGQFNVELLRDRGLTSGRVDARFTGYTQDLLSENAQGDPEGPAVGGAFTALLNEYNHNELKFGVDKDYNNTSNAIGAWNWTRGRRGGGFPGAPNVADDLAQAMITNPRLLVEVENGYYDMATPFFATEVTMDHLNLPDALKDHVQTKFYESGHMMYLNDASRVKLHNNIAAFVDKATKAVAQ